MNPGLNLLRGFSFIPEEIRDGTGSIFMEFRRVELLSSSPRLYGQDGSAQRSSSYTPGTPVAPGAGAVRG